MTIAVEVSDSIPSGRVSELPVVTRRTSRNTVTVKDQGTAVIAGLNETRRQVADKSTPGLSRLPLIGNLFDNTSDDKATRDIAIFITAKILKDPTVSSSPIIGPGGSSYLPQPQQPPMVDTTNFGDRRGNDFRSELSRTLARRR
jgi:Flp pilus assembly secretin CpaC